MENARLFGIPVVVAINKFGSDTDVSFPQLQSLYLALSCDVNPGGVGPRVLKGQGIWSL